MDKNIITALMQNCKDLKILYVEDNESARESTKSMLEKFFKNICIGIDGMNGLEKFKQTEYDLVITDINMPKMNGIEMIKEIRKINKNTPVLIISAYSESEYFMEAIKQNIDGYLLKPISTEQFINQLSKTVEKIQLTKKNERYKKGLETQIQERTQTLEYMFYHDSLTALKNKNALIADMEKEPFVAVLILDIDNFQDFNDIYGLRGGNKIIESCGALLESNLKEELYDIYYFHNDQFILRIKKQSYNINNFEKDIKELMETIHNFKIYLKVFKESINVDITIGVSFEEKYATEKAIMALKYAKKHKRPYAVYSKIVDRYKISKENLFWKDEIKEALKNDHIIPVFQPIVNRNKQIVKHEALMRLVKIKNSKEEMISPALFLETAMKTKQYCNLTKIMVEKSFFIMKKDGRDFSLNLSFEDIVNSSTLTMLKEKIDRYQIGKQLILEIVESENVEDYTIVKNFIKDFRQLGVRIAIDDFGAGFSNYMNILEIEPDYLKIDGSMIKELDKSKKSYIFVKSIVKLAKALGVQTIAEFVHSKEVFETCLELGVDQFQGYYFSPPIRESELSSVLKNESLTCT